MKAAVTLWLASFALLGTVAPSWAADPASPLDLLGAPLAQDQLGGSRARGVEPGTLAENNASFVGNTAINNRTGDISMTGSMSNNSGITSVFQNTGNNVVFQNATSIGITVR